MKTQLEQDPIKLFYLRKRDSFLNQDKDNSQQSFSTIQFHFHITSKYKVYQNYLLLQIIRNIWKVVFGYSCKEVALIIFQTVAFWKLYTVVTWLNNKITNPLLRDIRFQLVLLRQ